MANIIAVIWDCDKTLVDGYMQNPIFEEYEIDAKEFWNEINKIPDQIEKEKQEKASKDEEKKKTKIRVNRDTYYLNHFIREARGGRLDGLNNEKLRQSGEKLKFYKGIPDIFETTKNMFKDDKTYMEYGIQVEHYIVSTGFAETIRGSKLMPHVEDVWGCELLDGQDKDGKNVISEVVYTVDNTSKTRAIFEINKGIGIIEDIEVNSKIPLENRRVPFENMIYIADGPSDIPAFSVVKKNGGATFAIYPKGDMEAMKQVEQMRKDGRVDMYAEADYSTGTTAYMWITNQIQAIADRIRKTEQQKIASFASSVPRHLV